MENPNFPSKMENFIFDPTAGPVLETLDPNRPGKTPGQWISMILRVGWRFLTPNPMIFG